MDSQRVIGADAVSLIATLLRGEDDRWPIFLLGAGASFRSGVPTATEAVKQIARIVYSERKLLGARPPERVKPSEWEPWLREQTWFNEAAESLAENFPATVEHLLVPAELRKRVLLEIMNPSNGISSGYGVLAELVMRGLVSSAKLPALFMFMRPPLAPHAAVHGRCGGFESPAPRSKPASEPPWQRGPRLG